MSEQFLEILNVRILEPGTLISDILMALACFIFYSSLRKVAESKYSKHCAYYFLFMSLSSFIGALAHGLYLYTGVFLHIITWILSGIAVYFIEYSLADTIKKRSKKNLYINLIRIQLIVYVLVCCTIPNFLIVKINIVAGMLGVVFPIVLMQVYKKNEKNYIYIMLGILLALIPAFTHRIDFSFAEIFNMNDLSHFFIIFCQYLLYIGFKHHIQNYKPSLDV